MTLTYTHFSPRRLAFLLSAGRFGLPLACQPDRAMPARVPSGLPVGGTL